ncbi:MAG: hypothetical protein H0T42_29465, partial [Deltaproteobacteria bacterium]|nr:hypothetical protein [Deltaproteobacteria bacterium]
MRSGRWAHAAVVVAASILVSGGVADAQPAPTAEAEPEIPPAAAVGSGAPRPAGSSAVES